MEERPAAEQDDVGAGLLRHRDAPGEGGRVVDERSVPTIDAVRERGDRGLEVQHLAQRDGDDRAPRARGPRELADALGVRPPARPT